MISSFYPVIIAGCVTMHTLLLILTWAKTYRHWRRARQLKLPVVVTTYLLRDGTLYFFIMFVVSLIQLLIYVKGWPYISILLNVMPPILVIRFLFNLRQHESRTGNLSLSESGTPHGFSIPYLSSIDVFGNIGEPVNVDPDENGEGEELHENAPLGTFFDIALWEGGVDETSVQGEFALRALSTPRKRIPMQAQAALSVGHNIKCAETISIQQKRFGLVPGPTSRYIWCRARILLTSCAWTSMGLDDSEGGILDMCLQYRDAGSTSKTRVEIVDGLNMLCTLA
ncbi:uncharacterized protein PHACADRAFT_213011 [Phanerochaete carnosa HHB-10118-sp]|uniref:Uncharacterized protein n=1 Tax=Phanerochaete carnosa (strain HHB-10118-sp) TaxID=650164 RepID=K5VWA6_PHACS|nr:uncharacterized protein PHACADRAFT_213011 [Phanerochaete carnosa HHB-10118-sp]EKM51110.1 hypothetical protein PHACADRAFT_213011 [Phanerochaete carnosa HHB-10118-sp]